MAEYRPFKPNGSQEEREFRAAFCANCARNRRLDCRILIDALTLEPEDSDYPSEWRVDEDGPECAAFEPTLRRAVG